MGRDAIFRVDRILRIQRLYYRALLESLYADLGTKSLLVTAGRVVFGLPALAESICRLIFGYLLLYGNSRLVQQGVLW